MKQSSINARRPQFRAAILAAGIDLDTDFFALSTDEISKVHDLAKVFKYRRPAGYPGSLARAFYYSAQRAK